jgi:DcuC family C4-dicarboxylate transporter
LPTTRFTNSIPNFGVICEVAAMNDAIITLLGAAVVVATVVAIIRGIDVRLAMLLAGFVLGALAGDVASILKTFLATLADEKYIIPICSALGFAHVLRSSGCDRHLVMLLLKPVQKMGWLLIPGSVVVGFLVNIAVISQAGTAITVGTVLIPLLRSVGVRSAVIGAILVLGASVGGELLNPGAPELQSVVKRLSTSESSVDPQAMQRILAPILFVQLSVATLAFWCMVSREPGEKPIIEEVEGNRINIVKALVPILPLVLLLMAGAPLNWITVPRTWLTDPARPETYETRLIGASMLMGCVVAVLAAPSIWRNALRSFFEGVGYAMSNVISIIIAANCFGTGVKSLNLADWVGSLTKIKPGLIWPLAATLSMLFGMVSGSGMAATESLYRFFMQPGWPLEDNLTVGAVTSIAAAAGRTTSPAAAVVLLCAPLVGVRPMEIVRRVFGPLVLATVVTASLAWARH